MALEGVLSAMLWELLDEPMRATFVQHVYNLMHLVTSMKAISNSTANFFIQHFIALFFNLVNSLIH